MTFGPGPGFPRWRDAPGLQAQAGRCSIQLNGSLQTALGGSGGREASPSVSSSQVEMRMAGMRLRLYQVECSTSHRPTAPRDSPFPSP